MKSKKFFILTLTAIMILFAGSVWAATTTTCTLPGNVYRPAEFVVSSTTTNSVTAYTNVRFNITVSGPSDFTGSRADIFTITKVNGSSDTQGINDTFVLVAGDWVGYWGPATGFPLSDPYDATSTFTIQMNDSSPAPLGDYDVTVELVDLSPEPDVPLAIATDSFTLSADNLYVGTTVYEYQFTNIQDAIDAATTGDVINVAAGLYEEAVVIGKELTLLGATSGVDKNSFTLPATLGDYDSNTESIIKAPAAGNPNTVTITSSNVVLKGFVIEALDRSVTGGNDYNNLIYIDPSPGNEATMTGITIENNVIGPNTDITTQTKGRHGVRLNMGYGDNLSATITGNKIHGTYGNGNNVFIWGTALGTTPTLPSADLSGTVIQNNDICYSARSGIELSGAQGGLTIDNNRIYGNGAGHIGDDTNLKYGEGIAFVRDYVDVGNGVPGLGPNAGFVDGVTITNNEIYNNDKNGIYMGPMNKNHTITGNDIRDNGNPARVSGSSTFGPGDGIRIDLTGAYYLGWSNTQQLGSTSNIVANSNKIYDNEEYGAQVLGTPTNGFVLDAEENWWGDASGPSGEGPGTGDAVSANVDYSPWWGADYVGDSHATAWTWYTNDSIQDAIDASTAGDVINVAAGLYQEAITIGKSLTLLGATSGVDKNNFTLPATLGDYDTDVQSVIKAPAPYGGSNEQDNPNTVTITSSDVVLKGFVIEALDRDYHSGNNYNNLIELRPSGQEATMTGITIENNVIGPNTDTATQSKGRHGVRFTAGYGHTIGAMITGNKIHGTYGNGNNVFIWGTAFGTTGIPTAGPGPADLSGTVIQNNDICYSARSGIELSGAQGGLTIDNNRIYDNGAGHIGDDTNLKYGEGIAFVRDYVDVGNGVPGLGPDAGFVDGVTITNNEIYNNDKNGIYMGPMNKNHTITGNDIRDNGNPARVSGSSTFGPGDGIRIDLTGAYYLGWSNTQQLGSTSNIVAHSDKIYDNEEYGAQVLGIPTNSFALDATKNWWGDAKGPKHSTNPYNATTTGNAVSDYVTFMPWYATATTSPATENATLKSNIGGRAIIEVFTSDQLTEALANCSDNDIIVLGSATFDGDFTVNNDVTIQAADGAVPVIGGTITINSNGVTLDGLTIDADAGDEAIIVTGTVDGSTIAIINGSILGEGSAGQVAIDNNSGEHIGNLDGNWWGYTPPNFVDLIEPNPGTDPSYDNSEPVTIYITAPATILSDNETQTYSVKVDQITNLRGFNIGLKFLKADFGAAPSFTIGSAFTAAGTVTINNTDNSDATYWYYLVTGSFLGEPVNPTDVSGIPVVLFTVDLTTGAGVHKPLGSLIQLTYDDVLLYDNANPYVEIVTDGTTGLVIDIDSVEPDPIVWGTGDFAHPTPDANNSIDLDWTNPATDVTNLHVWALDYNALVDANGYPEYNPSTFSVPAIPWPDADDVDGTDGNWNRLTNTETGSTYNYTGMDRGYYYFTIYVEDAAGNMSVHPAEMKSSLSYWPGDVDATPDADVDSDDIALLSAVWGTDGSTNPVCDVGPAVGNYRLGRPTPDDAIDIEDLMIFAMNYLNTDYTHYTREESEEPEGISIDYIVHQNGNGYSIDLVLGDNTGNVKALNIPFRFEGLSFDSAVRGDIWTDSDFFIYRLDENIIEITGSTLSEDNIIDNGLIATVSFQIVSSNPGIELLDMTARTADNIEIPINSGEITGNEDEIIPLHTSLGTNYPNPFNPSTTIEFGLKKEEKVRISMYNIRGQKVKTLVNDIMPAGYHQVIWNGKNENNRPVSSGVYFYLMEAGNYTKIRRAILLK